MKTAGGECYRAAPEMAADNRHSTTCSYKYGPGVFLQAVVVHRCRAATVEGLRGRVDLQRFRQTPVPLQSDALLVTFKSEQAKGVTVAANWDITRTESKREKTKKGPTWPDSPPSLRGAGRCPWSRRAACRTVCSPWQWLHICSRETADSFTERKCVISN